MTLGDGQEKTMNMQLMNGLTDSHTLRYDVACLLWLGAGDTKNYAFYVIVGVGRYLSRVRCACEAFGSWSFSACLLALYAQVSIHALVLFFICCLHHGQSTLVAVR